MENVTMVGFASFAQIGVNVIFSGYTMDYRNQIEYAQNAAGRWFRRFQDKDPRYGYRWGAWSVTTAPDFSRFSWTGRKARTPKGSE